MLFEYSMKDKKINSIELVAKWIEKNIQFWMIISNILFISKKLCSTFYRFNKFPRSGLLGLILRWIFFLALWKFVFRACFLTFGSFLCFHSDFARRILCTTVIVMTISFDSFEITCIGSWLMLNEQVMGYSWGPNRQIRICKVLDWTFVGRFFAGILWILWLLKKGLTFGVVL